MAKKNPNKHHGKQNHQKMKPYLVMKHLFKHTDENNPMTADKLVAVLSADYGIYAERRSIYRDIEEINKAIIMLEQRCDIAKAEEILEEDDYDDEKLILYNKSKKGFYARPRNYDINDVRLLAECVYAAKFLSKSQTEFLVDILCEFVNDKQADTIKHDVLLVDRVRANNSEILLNVATINEAMSKEIDGEKHIPEKISFKYLYHSISDTKKQVERRHGESYVVSPYALLINDGNYYLLAFDDKKQKFIHYRVDRMKSVERTGEERAGEQEFQKIDLKSYTKKIFSMHSGEEKRITLRFINPLLDTAIDRFGKQDVIYTKVDERHFTATAKVEVSDQFFGWLLGFGKRVQIVSPPEVREEFASYLDKVREMY